MKKDIGIIKCRNCNAGDEYPVNALSKPIDVYCDWLDAVRKANLPQAVRIPVKHPHVLVCTTQACHFILTCL